MRTSIELVMASVVVMGVAACGNKEAQTEAASPVASAPVSSAPAAASAPAASASAAPAPAADSVIIEVRGSNVLVEGNVAGRADSPKLDELSARLKGTRETWMQLHPGQPFPGRATVKVEKGTSAAVVPHIVDAARAAGYPNVSLANP